MNGTRSARITHAIVAIAAVLLLLPGCLKEDDAASVSPTIAFSSDSGYVFRDDTVGMEDTLHVGIMITGGDDRIHTFKVLAGYDGAEPTTVDSFAISTSTFELDKTIVTRAVAGTEKWTFWVQEQDADVYRRSLTFLVE